jgi:hypothetical protein
MNNHGYPASVTTKLHDRTHVKRKGGDYNMKRIHPWKPHSF